MCDCLKQIKSQILKQGVRNVVIDLSNVSTTYTDGTVVRNQTGQRIEVEEVKMRKDGTEYFKRRKSFIAHHYCPFCGKEYGSKDF
jgi:catabolite regulation protein CreA